MHKLIILCLALFAILYINPVHSEWWTDDPVTNGLMISANTLMIIDWAQTRHIADNPSRFREDGIMRQFIGEHPKSGKTNKYFLGTIIANNALGAILPKKYKKTYYGILNLVYLSVTTDNASIGIKMNF